MRPFLATVGSRRAPLLLLVLASCAAPAPAPRRETAARPPAPSASAPDRDAGPEPIDLVMNPADCTKEPSASVSRADELVDLAAVALVVRGGWAGYETMTKRGVDFDRIFADGAAWIAKAPEPIAVDAFQNQLVALLRPAADNHMAFFAFTPKGHARRKAVGTHARAFTGDLVVLGDAPPLRIVDPGKPRHGAELVACAGHDLETLLRPTVDLGSGGLRAARRPIVLAENAPQALSCTIRLESKATEEMWISMRPLQVGRKPASTPVVDIKEGPLPVLQARSFWSAHGAELDRFVASAAKLRSAKAIVVDLRGNGGGSSDYARRWLGDLTTGSFGGTSVELLESDVTREGIFNANLCEIEEGIADPAARKETQERLDHARLVLDTGQRAHERFRRWRPTRQTSVEGKAPSAFGGVLVVLVDNACASACESFLSMATGLGRTVIVGENSGGVGIFGEVIVYRLPKSGLGMSAGMKHFHASDPAQEIVEGRGFAPNLWLDVPAKEDALPLAVRIADCLSKPTCALAKPGPR